MTVPQAHVGDTGTILTKVVTDGTSIIDVSGATLQKVHFRDPDGNTKELVSVFVTDGTDGQIKVTTLVGTWDVAGNWLEQVQITLPSGDWASVAEKREVHERIF